LAVAPLNAEQTLDYRLYDTQWTAIVNWTVEALIQAEESGVMQANLAEMKKSGDPVSGRQRAFGDDVRKYLKIQRQDNAGPVLVVPSALNVPLKSSSVKASRSFCATFSALRSTLASMAA